jgi:Holliday junction resolvase RusA-like endonuclease
MTYSIWIPRWWPPSGNVLLETNPMRRSRVKREVARIVWYYGYMAGVPKAKGHRKVRVKVALGPRMVGCDPDNYNKILRDALASCGLVTDDRSTAATFSEPEIDRDHRDNPGTLIEIEEAP